MSLPLPHYRYFVCTVAYEGTHYAGWQSQKEKTGVQDCIERVIKKLWGIEERIVAASRTDAGVHALGQVMKIAVPQQLSQEKIITIINNALPSDILITALSPCSPEFSPRFAAEQKEYRYQIAQKKPLPATAPFVYYYPYPFSLPCFTLALSAMEGTHDFISFATTPEEKNTIKTIKNITVTSGESLVTITIVGTSFLRYMIRRIVGGALWAATRNYPPEWLVAIREKKDNRNHAVTLPPQGLTLMKIWYDRQITPEMLP